MAKPTPCELLYHVVGDYWKSEQKERSLTTFKSIAGVPWKSLTPDNRANWLVPEHASEFAEFLPIGSKQAKATKEENIEAIFHLFSGGVKTNRDDVVYQFDRRQLKQQVQDFIEEYNAEVDRFKRTDYKGDIFSFLRFDRIKWSETLIANVAKGKGAVFNESSLRICLYRPFQKEWLYFNEMLVERRYLFPLFFPTAETENVLIWLKVGSSWPMFALAANGIVDLLPVTGSQCFPFYVYDEDGSNRRENITDWALTQFRRHYGDDSIGKWDIFHYVYGLLHHPGYRGKFADNLKRELPRLPFAPSPPTPLPLSTGGEGSSGFRAFASAGADLARLHLDYEKLEPYPLTWLETPGVPLSYRIEDKMRLSKDKTTLIVNPSLTLSGIPPETFAYRLGNRSALEWVIDQYQVSEDKRSGIRSDPNRANDPEYIVRLVGQVVRVSVETVRIVAGLPSKFSP